jgi:hypothetical protein
MATWTDASEIVAGAVYKRLFAPHETDTLKISQHMVRPEMFAPPYNDFVKSMLVDEATPEDVVAQHTNTFQITKYAVESLNGAGEAVDWVMILEQSRAKAKAAQHFKRVAKKLDEGEDIDWSKISTVVAGAQLLKNSDSFTSLSDVDRKKIPFIPTGYEPIDKHLLGVPEVGITLLFGPKKSGKTSLALQIAGSFVKAHKKKRVGFFSMEMLAPYLASRMDQLFTTSKGKKLLTSEQEERILIRDLMETPEEVINRAATIDDLGIMFVDFADLLIRGETSESSMGHVYRTLAIGAKQLGIPIVLLAHPNRMYQGGIPRPEQVRWTGLASNLAEMILATYNPEKNISYAYTGVDDKILRPIRGMCYLVAWEIRAGFRIHENDSPGAIQIPFRGKMGWHPKKANWFQIKD